jgi:putative FmdB family regulatory protein
MPLFEYRCEDCRRRFTLLVGMTAEVPTQACPRCGSTQFRKLISRFAVARSEDDILDSIADPTGLGDPEDPRAMASWMRKVSREMGEDLGDDFDELVEEAVREEETGPAGADTEGAGASDAAE